MRNNMYIIKKGRSRENVRTQINSTFPVFNIHACTRPLRIHMKQSIKKILPYPLSAFPSIAGNNKVVCSEFINTSGFFKYLGYNLKYSIEVTSRELMIEYIIISGY